MISTILVPLNLYNICASSFPSWILMVPRGARVGSTGKSASETNGGFSAQNSQNVHEQPIRCDLDRIQLLR